MKTTVTNFNEKEYYITIPEKRSFRVNIVFLVGGVVEHNNLRSSTDGIAFLVELWTFFVSLHYNKFPKYVYI